MYSLLRFLVTHSIFTVIQVLESVYIQWLKTHLSETLPICPMLSWGASDGVWFRLSALAPRHLEGLPPSFEDFVFKDIGYKRTEHLLLR